MPKVETLTMYENQIGYDGLKALVDATEESLGRNLRGYYFGDTRFNLTVRVYSMVVHTVLAACLQSQRTATSYRRTLQM